MARVVFNNPVLTSAEMRAADAATIAAGTESRILMKRAGQAVVMAVTRLTAPDQALVLCGPGNNGGDGYVIAQMLLELGWDVAVAQLGPPLTDDARFFASLFEGPVTNLADALPAPVLIDALFGTGMARPLSGDLADNLARLMQAATTRIGVDLPSGVDTDSGALLGARLPFDMTVALGALKPAHLLFPAASLCGRVVVADIGIAVSSDAGLIQRPLLHEPGFDDHKYSRGFVVVAGGVMAGAAHLSARAAQASGAGYVLIASEQAAPPSDPQSIVQRHCTPEALNELIGDKRIGAVVAGPGLGRGSSARRRLSIVLKSHCKRLVLDADALSLLSESAVPLIRQIEGKDVILTPHEGEFERLFGPVSGSRIDCARQAARMSGAVVILKGACTVVAAPDGRVGISSSHSGWLATAGTGDVLSGCVAAMLASGKRSAFDAACAAVWVHGAAARKAGPALIADDLVPALQTVQAAYHG